MPLVERAVPTHQARNNEERVIIPGGGLHSMIPKKRPTVPQLIPRKQQKKCKKNKKRRYRSISSKPRTEDDSDDARPIGRDTRKKFKKRRHRVSSSRSRKIIPSDDSDNELLLVSGKINPSLKRKKHTKSYQPGNVKSSDDSDDAIITKRHLSKSVSEGDASGSLKNSRGDRLQQKKVPVNLLLSESSDDDLIVSNQQKVRLTSKQNEKTSHSRTIGSEGESVNIPSSSDDDLVMPNERKTELSMISTNGKCKNSSPKLTQLSSDDEMIITIRSEGDETSKGTSLPKPVEVASGSESESEDEPIPQFVNGKYISNGKLQTKESEKSGLENVGNNNSNSILHSSKGDLTEQVIRDAVPSQTDKENDEERNENLRKPSDSLQISESANKSDDECRQIALKESPIDEEALSNSHQVTKESTFESVSKAQSDSDSDEPISISRKSKESVASTASPAINTGDDKSTFSKIDSKNVGSDSDDEPISKPKKSKKKKEKKATKKRASNKKTTKPKKKYDMPGQKKDTPNELNGARIFYETLREQIPESKMAEDWLLKYGLLPLEEAKAIVEAQQKSKGKSSTYVRPRTKAMTVKKKKRKIVDILSGESSSDEPLTMKKKEKTSNETKEDQGIVETNVNASMSRESSFNQGASSSKMRGIPSGESSSDEGIIMHKKTPTLTREPSLDNGLLRKKQSKFLDSSSDEDIIIAKN